MGKGNWDWEKAFDWKQGMWNCEHKTHGERKNRVQSFIKQPININWIQLCFKWVSSITNNHYYSTLTSISKSVSCHFSHLFIPFISSLSFFFSWNEKSISNCFLLPNCREARVSTSVCFKVWTSSSLPMKWMNKAPNKSLLSKIRVFIRVLKFHSLFYF